MYALVVFESMFGNTELIAEAVGQGLRHHADVDVDVVRVADVGGEQVERADILVVGGPTHAFGMSRMSTRLEAKEQAAYPADVQFHTGIREWFSSLPVVADRRPAAAFDTRVDKVRKLPGRASKAASRELRRHGYRLATPARSFYVSGTEGPLIDGELQRATEWGELIGSAASSRRSISS
jgi:flavorubredoxin